MKIFVSFVLASSVDCSVSKDFRDQVSEYFTPLSPTVYLYVHY